MGNAKTVKEAIKEVKAAAEEAAKETARVRADGRRIVVSFGRKRRR